MPPKKANAVKKPVKKTVRKTMVNLRDEKHKFYCVKCKDFIQAVPSGVPKKTKNGAWMIHGTCPNCSISVHTFISDEARNNFNKS